ncbi:hypothetical protein [Escherichia phage PHB11]|jgi:hypothetical protein|uniref:Uncharacterized protein n=10 Tax=Felixounavirus TaxID=1198140 RepID=A0A7U0J660_9CAUD|nr:hypothetical protein FDJ22_gp010 [Salmonella phage BPS17W1]YP_010676247.1 hypothetical protein PQD19_gp028 [Salmonella phage vB_SAg-RPN213]AUM59317.1 hypothetical protein BPS15S6_100 [Salmonella phage BPS15S6]AUM59466.1 hypothetical protein BPS17S6_119 [Salmonella phage BPS17S6]MDA5728902.1 hypothetical protein [Listeria monocytogenes]MKE62501.1 hypothetical protein [Shigella flexneri]QBJ00713.1 hypothetical protein [Escherichia phage PHB11]QEP52935.1 hypothetical protein [Salmonella phag
MAIIKNVVIPAKTRDDARIMAKKLGGKVVDNGKQTAVRWNVKADKQMNLKNSPINLFTCVNTIGKTNVYTKKAYIRRIAMTSPIRTMRSHAKLKIK